MPLNKETKPNQVREELVVMSMEMDSTLSRAPELEPHHQIQFSVIPKTSLFSGYCYRILRFFD